MNILIHESETQVPVKVTGKEVRKPIRSNINSRIGLYETTTISIDSKGVDLFHYWNLNGDISSRLVILTMEEALQVRDFLNERL